MTREYHREIIGFPSWLAGCLTRAFWGAECAMDQRELSADFGRLPGVDNSEAWRVDLNAPDMRDLEPDSVAASDGDGGMLGRVLIYTAIIAVLAVALWSHS